MLYQLHSSKPLAEIESALQDSASRNKFGVIVIHDLRETMKEKGVDLAMECRISVYGSKGNYTLATMRPTAV